MADNKKYYWLKLDRNFFKRHDIRIIEAMDNGKDYVLFYMKLLLESIDHEGKLRFNDLIPYNDSMLATITNTNIDIVRSAIKIFSQLNLMEVWDDQTIYITDTQKMIGEETEWAKKKREYRDKKQIMQIEEKDNVRTKKDNVRQEKEKELEIEIDKEIDKKKVAKRFTPPSLDEVTVYCKERSNAVNPQRFIDYYTSNGWMVGKNKMKDWKATVRGWESRETENKSSPKNRTKVIAKANDDKPDEVVMTAAEREAMIARINEGLKF